MKVSRLLEELSAIAKRLEDGNENDCLEWSAGIAYAELIALRSRLLRAGFEADEAPRNLVKVK
jgi:hypothetical protein